MKQIAPGIALMLASACATPLTFVDQGNGVAYSGVMQDSITEDGRITATIEGVDYTGTWAIENSGNTLVVGEVKQSEDRRLTRTSQVKISTGNTSAAPDTAMAFARIKENSAEFAGVESHAGTGRIVLTSETGGQILCTYDPAGITTPLRGLCTRDDGVVFELFSEY